MHTRAMALFAGLAALSGCKPNATDLVHQAVEARGGAERLHAIHSLRLTGKISFGLTEGTLRIDFKRPNQMRMELGFPDGMLVRLFDGTSGWTSNASAGRVQFEPMSPLELSNIRREADMDGPLLDFEAKGIRITRAGRGQFGGRATEGLEISFRDGTVQHYALDAVSHEPVGFEEQSNSGGAETPLTSIFRMSRRVDGVLFATAIDSGAAGSPPSQRVTIETIELNPILDDARFRPPTLGPRTQP